MPLQIKESQGCKYGKKAKGNSTHRDIWRKNWKILWKETSAFSSMICCPSSFNWLVARILFLPLEGVTSICTDGNPSYKNANPILCIVHRFRKIIQSKEIKELEKEIHPNEFHEMLHYIFEEFKGEITETMKKIYPDLVEDDEFIGALSTNAIEGGNWRRKNLRTSYSNLEANRKFCFIYNRWKSEAE